MPSTATISNSIIYNQPKIPNAQQKNQSSLVILVSLWLHAFLVITLIFWWYISIFTLWKSLLCMEMRPTIILPSLPCDLSILWLKLPKVKYIGYWAISPISCISTVLFIASKTSIIVTYFTPKFIRACYVVYYQLTIGISLYMHSFLLLFMLLLCVLSIE